MQTHHLSLLHIEELGTILVSLEGIVGILTTKNCSTIVMLSFAITLREPLVF
jgi:hypothetical protein